MIEIDEGSLLSRAGRFEDIHYSANNNLGVNINPVNIKALIKIYYFTL